jgi:hypothetical protein
MVVARPGLAVNPMDTGDNRYGVPPQDPMTEPVPRYDNEHMVVPRPPAQPTAVSRPASWPGGRSIPSNQYPSTSGTLGQTPLNPASQGTPFVQPGQNPQYANTSLPPANMAQGDVAQQGTPASPVELFEGTTILARVGSEAIFAYEIMGGINEILEQNKDKIRPDQLEATRTLLIKKSLVPRIQSKLIYINLKQTIPAERLPDLEKQISKGFESSQLPGMLKRSGVATSRELDQKLRGLGSSLDREKKTFIEHTLVSEWVRQQIKRDEEITYDQMLNYYKAHQSEFEKPARAKWEELMISFSKYRNKVEAYNTIARLGNQVFTGTAFAEVAKNGSQGLTTAQGGAHDWTTMGSLVCADLDQAIFKLPVGRLSQIIESDKGYHIIRVTERTDTTYTPFLTAQVDIKEKIVQERTNKQLQEYLARLEDKIPIWTIYDGDRKDLRLADRLKEISR